MSRLISCLFVLLLLTALSLSISSCTPAASARITVVDDAWRAVYIEQTPERVVSLAPSITETLFSMDLGHTVVAVTDHCDYPEEAKAKAKVGGYFTTSLESILDKDPDLILTDGHDPVAEQIVKLDIPVLVLQPKDIFGIFRNIQLLGKVMNQEEKAARLVNNLQERLDAVAEITAGATSRPTVFFEIDAADPTKPWTAGQGSFADALITLAGGTNIVTESTSWLQLSLETLVSADPDFIVLGDYPYVNAEQVSARSGAWRELTAVKLGRVCAISDPSLTSRPGPRIIDGLEELARIIHPELYPS